MTMTTMTTTPLTNNTSRHYDNLLLYESTVLQHLDCERRRPRRRRCCNYKIGSTTSSLAMLLLLLLLVTIIIFIVDAVDSFEISSRRINRYKIISRSSSKRSSRRCNIFTTSSTSRIQKYTGDTTAATTTSSDRGWKNANTVLFAVMYGTDGKKISDDLSSDNDGEDDSTSNEPSFIPDRRFDTKLVEKLNTKTSVSSLLKVVACAFAEPPHDTILPKNVVVATLVEISKSRMDVALGVKTYDESLGGGGSGGSPSSDGQQSLVQLLVKVPLTTPCPSNKSNNNDDEIDNDVAAECVAKTLTQLEPCSVARIEKRELRQKQTQDGDKDDDDNEEEEWPPKIVTDIIETSSTKESSSTVVSTGEKFYGDAKPDSSYRYPDWWTFPSPLEKTLSDECDSMKLLLNEDDFANDRIQLSKEGQKDPTKEVPSNVVIQRSFVAIIGPAGLVMRTQQSVKDDEMNVVEVLVPVRFVHGAIAKSPETLRDRVLELVESLEDTERQEKESTEDNEELLVQDPEAFVESRVTSAAPQSDPALAPSSVSETRNNVELAEDVVEARRQPKSPAEESRLAAKYASIENIGDRAFAILKDLHMI